MRREGNTSSFRCIKCNGICGIVQWAIGNMSVELRVIANVEMCSCAHVCVHAHAHPHTHTHTHTPLSLADRHLLTENIPSGKTILIAQWKALMFSYN